MEIKLGKYKHFKGKFYQVIGLAFNAETKEKMVLYKCLYPVKNLSKEFGPEPIFVRTAKNFTQTTKFDDKKIPRFKYVD